MAPSEIITTACIAGGFASAITYTRKIKPKKKNAEPGDVGVAIGLGVVLGPLGAIVFHGNALQCVVGGAIAGYFAAHLA